MKKFDAKAAAATLSSPAPTPSLPAAPAGDAAAFLSRVGGAQKLSTVPAATQSSTPFIGFYEKSGNEEQKAKIIAALGAGLPVGTPYLEAGGKIYRADGMAFTFLDVEPFFCWTTFSGANAIDRVWLEDPGVKQVEGNSVGEQARAVLLVLPGSQPLPEALGPAVVATCSFRTSKVPAIRALKRGLDEAMTPEWAKANGALAQVAPCFRQPGVFRISQKVVRSGQNKGRTYGHATMVCAPVSVAQAAAIQAWAAGTGPAQAEDAARLYDFVVEGLKATAATTAPAPKQ